MKKIRNWCTLLMVAYRAKDYYMEEWHTVHKPYSKLVEVGIWILCGFVGVLVSVGIMSILHIIYKV